jgi:signal recognition particle receptor subunit beta
MTKTVKGKPARAGDEIIVAGHAVGVPGKTGTIVEVVGEPGHERFRVHWEDGRETILSPGDDALIRRPRRQRAKSTA